MYFIASPELLSFVFHFHLIVKISTAEQSVLTDKLRVSGFAINPTNSLYTGNKISVIRNEC